MQEVYWVGGDVRLRWPLLASSPRRAAEEYERGRRQGHGVCLEMFCLAGRSPCCRVVVPDDAEDAAWQMIAGLKLSACHDPPQARRLHPWVWWLWWTVGGVRPVGGG